MSIRQKIEAQQYFTETERCVASYILERPLDVLEMSIRDLSQVTYTSTPTVLRVCRKLDFEGYREMKKALLPDLEQISKIATFHSQISIEFVLNALYSLIYEKDYERHEQHKSMLDTVSF